MEIIELRMEPVIDLHQLMVWEGYGVVFVVKTYVVGDHFFDRCILYLLASHGINVWAYIVRKTGCSLCSYGHSYTVCAA